jgi:hypothetical protein
MIDFDYIIYLIIVHHKISLIIVQTFFRPEVLDLLLDRSQNDSDEQVRKYAEDKLVRWRSR